MIELLNRELLQVNSQSAAIVCVFLQEQINKYWELLNKVLLGTPDGPVMPELYVVPQEMLHEEKRKPKSTKKIPAGRIPHLWGQSLFLLGSMLKEGLIFPGISSTPTRV